MISTDVGVVNALGKAQEASDWVQKYLLVSLITITTLAFAGAVVLYIGDHILFGEIAAFLWKARVALFSVAVLGVGTWILGRQAAALRRASVKTVVEINTAIETLSRASAQTVAETNKAMERLKHTSAQSVNEINKAMGQLQDASDSLSEATKSARITVAQFKTLSVPQLPAPTTPPQSVPPQTDKKDYWDDLSDAWREAKQLIEERIDNIDNTKLFDKYSTMKRHDYKPILESLVRDKKLVPDARQPFESMKQAFYAYRPQVYVVPKDEWLRFKGNLEELKRLTGAQPTQIPAQAPAWSPDI